MYSEIRIPHFKIRIVNYPWVLRVAPFIVTGFLGSFAFRLSMPAVATLIGQRTARWVLGAATVSSAYVPSRGAAAVLSGWLYDRAGGRIARLPPAAMAVFAAVTLAYPAAGSAWAIAALRGFQGLLSGLAWPIVQTSLALNAPSRVRGRVLSVYFALGSAAGIAANAAYAAIASWPPEAQLALSAALFALAAVAIAAAPAQPPRQKGARVAVKGQVSVIAASSIIGIPCSFAFGELSYVLLSRALGLGMGATALVVAGVTAASSAISYALSWAADRGFEKHMLAISAAAAAVAPLMLAAGRARGSSRLRGGARRQVNVYAPV